MKFHCILTLMAALGSFAGTSLAEENPAPTAKPAETKGKPAAPEAKKGDPIKVTSEGGAEMNQKKDCMVYLKNVKFLHPAQNLEMTCDRLEVYRDPPPPPKPKPTLDAEAAGAVAPEDEPQLEIREAIALGNVEIKKKGADGKVSIGKCQKAVFDGKTQEILLSGSPQPQLAVGSDYIFYADTITLKEDGQHKLGNNSTTLLQEKKKGGAGEGKER